MGSLTSDFEELLASIKQGRDFYQASFEPVYYLIFHPKQILEVKRMLPAWISRLRIEGWYVHTLSMTEAVLDVFKRSPLRKIWVTADRKAPQQWEKTNQSLANVLTGGALLGKFENALERTAADKNGILLVTDLEAIHPYLRIGSIESQLYGKFRVPTVFLYPGIRTGKTRLKFLGFYPEDGNYRSVHIGG